MSIIRKFRNTDDSFGDAGPWEADSKEELADGMQNTFGTWASEAEDKAYEMARDLGGSLEGFDRQQWIALTREKFIDALVEEITGPAVEVFGLTVHQRGAEFCEIGDGAERVIVTAHSLDEAVTMEADNEDAKRAAYDEWSVDAVRDPSDFGLLDSNEAAPVSAKDLGIDDEEYLRLVRESMLSNEVEGHVLTSTGRRVYADD